MYRDAPGPLLIVAFRERVFGMDRVTGAVRWRAEVGPHVNTAVVELAVDEDVVVACSPHRLTFIDYATGAIRKRIDREDRATGGRPVMLIDGEQVFIGGPGSVACYTRLGDLLWDEGFKGEGYGSVALGVPHRVRQADEVGS